MVFSLGANVSLPAREAEPFLSTFCEPLWHGNNDALVFLHRFLHTTRLSLACRTIESIALSLPVTATNRVAGPHGQQQVPVHLLIDLRDLDFLRTCTHAINLYTRGTLRVEHISSIFISPRAVSAFYKSITSIPVPDLRISCDIAVTTPSRPT